MKKINLIIASFLFTAYNLYSQDIATTLSSNTDDYLKYLADNSESAEAVIASNDIRGLIDLNISNIENEQLEVVLDSDLRDTGIVKIVNVKTGKRIRRKVSFFKGQIKIPVQDAKKGIYEVQVKTSNSSNKIKKRFSVK
ncbi:hypothetical protein [Aquimarina agarivorans]|uniref:hypothetical protein n=1 Tax=Aquimarina agarivorans TaxID=980584 RepID=UPI000248F2AA|nr:hypothetical protein [Aquimarina agarivorans]